MLTIILGFVSKFISPYLKYIGIGVAIIGAYFYWQHVVASNARQVTELQLKIQEQQQNMLEQQKTIDVYNNYIKTQKSINESQTQANQDLIKKNQALTDQLTNINNYLSSPDAFKNDRAVSIDIQKTLEYLQNQVKQNEVK